MNTFLLGVLVLSIPNLTFTLAGFEPIRQRAITEFDEQIIPAINNHFVSLGAMPSSAYRGLINRAKQDLNARIISLESEYRCHWLVALQLESMGQLTKNQKEYDWLLSQIKDIIAYAKKIHYELQDSINRQFATIGNSSQKHHQAPLPHNDIKIVIITFLMRVGTETAWILLNDLEQNSYLL